MLSTLYNRRRRIGCKTKRIGYLTHHIRQFSADINRKYNQPETESEDGEIDLNLNFNIRLKLSENDAIHNF